MTNLDSVLKSRDITLSTKVSLVKAMVFPVVMYGCESWTVKKAVLKLMSIESLMPSNHLILCSPFSSGLQSFPASGSFPASHFFTSDVSIDPVQVVFSRLNDKPEGWLGPGCLVPSVMIAGQGLGTWP